MKKNEIWNKYWKKQSVVSRLMELVNESYFSKVFERHFLKEIGDVRGLKILEAGCGSGKMSSRLAKKGAKVTLLDYSKEALNVAKANIRKVKAKAKLVKQDLFKTRFKDYDVVWNQGVIEHFDNPVKAIKKMLSIIKPKGKIVIFVPAYLSPLCISYMLLTVLGRLDLWMVDKQTFFKEKDLRKIMIEAGCNHVKVKRLFDSFFFSCMGVGRK